jgi:hypothetical protein
MEIRKPSGRQESTVLALLVGWEKSAKVLNFSRPNEEKPWCGGLFQLALTTPGCFVALIGVGVS